MTNPFENDEDFLGYCEIHARTERALFSRDQVARLCSLAGVASPKALGNWTSLPTQMMAPLLEEAKAALKRGKLAALPLTGSKVRVLDKDPTTASWRGVEAKVLAEAILPETAQIQIQRLDTYETGIIDVSSVVVIEPAPLEPIPEPKVIWLRWAKAEIQMHRNAIAAIEKAIRDEGLEP